MVQQMLLLKLVDSIRTEESELLRNVYFLVDVEEIIIIIIIIISYFLQLSFYSVAVVQIKHIEINVKVKVKQSHGLDRP
jgi:hypothetical protein